MAIQVEGTWCQPPRVAFHSIKEEGFGLRANHRDYGSLEKQLRIPSTPLRLAQEDSTWMGWVRGVPGLRIETWGTLGSWWVRSPKARARTTADPPLRFRMTARENSSKRALPAARMSLSASC
jgi:hypothetical protein